MTLTVRGLESIALDAEEEEDEDRDSCRKRIRHFCKLSFVLQTLRYMVNIEAQVNALRIWRMY